MSALPIPAVRRLWGIFRHGSAGRLVLDLSAREPDVHDMQGALLLTGMLADDSLSLAFDLVSDPKADPDLAGPEGPSGWTPVLVPETDGTRTLIRIVDWMRSKAKPAVGYLTAAGLPTVAKADAFNFNQIKRVDIFSAVTASTGIADVVFTPAFTTTPAKALPMAANNLLGGIVTAEIVAGSLTKTGCKVKVQQKALLTGVLSTLTGASVSVIAIEA